MTASYDNALVLLSIVVAMMASYTALDLAGRVTHSSGRSALMWLLGGSLSMGAGIWSMHFIGMLAFELPIRVFYDPWITAASMVIAVVTSGYALSVVSRRVLGGLSLYGGGVIMGGGIAAMHYSGMAAMRMSPPIDYDAGLFAMSIVIAVAASTAALWLAFIFRSAVSQRAVTGKILAAAVMGCAIAGMHYTGMAAAGFDPDSVCLVTGGLGLSNTGLAATLGTVILSLLIATLIAASFDSRLATRTAQMLKTVELANAALSQSNDRLLSAQASLAESEERFRSAFESATIGMGLVSMDGRWLRVNPSLCRIFGYPETELLSADYQSISHPEDLQADTEQARRLAAGEVQSYQIEKRYFHKAGHVVWVHLGASIVNDSDGNPRHFVMQIEDISARKRAEEALRLSEDRFRRLAEHAPMGIAIQDDEGRVVFVNQHFVELLRYRLDDIPTIEAWWQRSLPDPVYRAEVMATLAEDQERLQRGEIPRLPVRQVPVTCGDGVVREVEIRSTREDGQTYTVVNDVTERHRAQEALQSLLREQALRDPLTALFNRRHLEDAVESEFARARRNGDPLSIVMIDIDHFKSVNDRHGHACGDEVIRRVAQLLVASVRRSDTACRYGGEEFMLILPGAPAARAQELAEEVRLMVRSTRHDCSGLDIGSVTVSCGIAVFPVHGASVEQVLAAADQALYSAKEQGRDRVVLAPTPGDSS